MKPIAAPGSEAVRLGDERDLVLVDHQLGQLQVGRLAVPAEEPCVADPQVAARRVDQVGQSPEPPERDHADQPQVRSDQLDRFLAAAPGGVEALIPGHRRIVAATRCRDRDVGPPRARRWSGVTGPCVSPRWPVRRGGSGGTTRRDPRRPGRGRGRRPSRASARATRTGQGRCRCRSSGRRRRARSDRTARRDRSSSRPRPSSVIVVQRLRASGSTPIATSTVPSPYLTALSRSAHRTWSSWSPSATASQSGAPSSTSAIVRSETASASQARWIRGPMARTSAVGRGGWDSSRLTSSSCWTIRVSRSAWSEMTSAAGPARVGRRDRLGVRLDRGQAASGGCG